MIVRLNGTLLEKNPPYILVDVHGVGYELEAPMSTCFQLPETGKEVVLYTHLIVREDAQLLCGFATHQERTMFRTLIKVNGVGAKLALTILSGISATEFAQSVHDNDTAALTQLPGVGKKTAERLIVEMRDKLDEWAVQGTGSTKSDISGTGEASSNREALSALLALGYKQAEANRLLQKVDSSVSGSEDIIKAALKLAAMS